MSRYLHALALDALNLATAPLRALATWAGTWAADALNGADDD